MTRRPILVAAAILLFGAGFAAGRLTLAPTPPASAVVAPVEKPAATRSAGRAPLVEAVPGDELATAKAEAAAWKALYEGLALEVYGVPVPFPADTPEKHTERGFRDALDEILRVCDVPAELVSMDCSEYPCMAGFREVPNAAGVTSFGEITHCPAWAERYGPAATMSHSSVDCGDGRVEPVLILSAHWEEGYARLNGEDDNLQKRLGARWEETEEQWACAPPPAP